MLRPYSRRRPARPRCAIDAWIDERWTLLERHERTVAAAPEVALRALAELRLRDLPAVRALFTLRRMRHDRDATLRGFFSTAPFVLLEDVPGRELVSGVLLPRRGAGGRRPPSAPDAFRRALDLAPVAAVATFRADPLGEGAALWTETWVRTNGAAARAGFAAYWLAIGPWSAWIRRILLRAARDAAEAAPPGAR